MKYLAEVDSEHDPLVGPHLTTADGPWKSDRERFQFNDGSVYVVINDRPGEDGLPNMHLTRRQWALQTPLPFGQLVVPAWMLPTAAAIPVLLWVVTGGRSRLRVRRRWELNRRGLCWKCRYDLLYSNWRCPECGMVNDQIPVAR
jgi:hypothetical protein